jgi:type IV pilus assembly protein PilC
MPSYRWKGIDQQGATIKGTLQAPSPDQVQEQLLQQGIALLQVSPISQTRLALWSGLGRPISAQHICDFFDSLALLITQGIELEKALTILSHQTASPALNSIIEHLATSLTQGNSLEVALQAYPHVFSPHITHLIGIGEKTGKLGLMLSTLKNQLLTQEAIKKQLKQAALMPLVTLTISLGLVGSIVIFVVPHFDALYKSMNASLPGLTKGMISLSRALRSWGGPVALMGLIVTILLLKRVFTYKTIKPYLERITLHLPLIKSCIITRDVISFLQTLHVYAVSGLPLTMALDQSLLDPSSQVFKHHLHNLQHMVMEGKNLSDALEMIGPPFFDAQTIALIRVGEHSGTMTSVLEKTLQRQQQKLTSTLHTATTIFAPLLMVVVGLCIGGLMIMLYLPIFNLGSLIGR